MVQIQCQPSVTAAVRKGLSKPVFHPRQTSVQETQGLGLLWVTFPSCSLLITHGLRLLVHTTALISVKPLPLLSQPSLPSSPSVWRHSTPSTWSSLARELKDAQPSPPPVKQKQLPTPCAVSTEQQPEPSHDSYAICQAGSGHLLGGMGRVYLTNKNKTAAGLHLHNGRLKSHLNDRGSQIQIT